MKKIAIITCGILPLPPVKGGAVENLTHFLVQQNELQNEVQLTVFSVWDKDAFAESQKYKKTEFVYINKPKYIVDKITDITNRVFCKLRFGSAFQIFPFLIDAVKIIKKSDFDCILVENRADFVPFLRKKLSIPIYLHMHNDYLNNKYFLAKEVMQSSTKIFAVSEYVKQCILTIDQNATNVEVLRNVIDLDVFASVSEDIRNDLRSSYGFKQSDVVFSFFGRLTPGKGIKELVQAFIKLAEKYDNVRLLIVGSTWFSSDSTNDFLNELKEISLCCNDRIVFTGYVDYSKINRQYACSDVVVVPSIYGEAASLAALEAMATGKALIISDSGGISEYVSSECAIEIVRGEGFIEHLTNAMNLLVINEELRKNLARNAKIRATQYNKDNYLNDVLKYMKINLT